MSSIRAVPILALHCCLGEHEYNTSMRHGDHYVQVRVMFNCLLDPLNCMSMSISAKLDKYITYHVLFIVHTIRLHIPIIPERLWMINLKKFGRCPLIITPNISQWHQRRYIITCKQAINLIVRVLIGMVQVHHITSKGGIDMVCHVKCSWVIM